MTNDDLSFRPTRHRDGIDGAIQRLEVQASLTWPSEAPIVIAETAPGSCVVELGCGSGAILRRLCNDLPGCRVIGVDNDSALLNSAAAAAPHAQLVVADATATPLGNNTADVVILRYLLQHLTDPAAALREAHRLLRPGGRLVVLEVDGGLWGISQPHLPELEALQARIWSSQRHRGGNRMVGRRLRTLIRQVGFADDRLDLYHYSSDDRPLRDFGPLLDPTQYLDLVEDGVLEPAELASAAVAYRRWLDAPESWLMMVGFAVSGVKRSDASPTT